MVDHSTRATDVPQETKAEIIKSLKEALARLRSSKSGRVDPGIRDLAYQIVGELVQHERGEQVESGEPAANDLGTIWIRYGAITKADNFVQCRTGLLEPEQMKRVETAATELLSELRKSRSVTSPVTGTTEHAAKELTVDFVQAVADRLSELCGDSAVVTPFSRREISRRLKAQH